MTTCLADHLGIAGARCANPLRNVICLASSVVGAPTRANSALKRDAWVIALAIDCVCFMDCYTVFVIIRLQHVYVFFVVVYQ